MSPENEKRLLDEALLQAILHARDWQRKQGFALPSAQLRAWEELAAERGVFVPQPMRKRVPA